MNVNTEMRLPALSNFGSIAANISDLKNKVNELQTEKRSIRKLLDIKQEDINKLIKEIENMESN